MKRISYIGRRLGSPQRPRLCVVCHEPAEFVEVGGRHSTWISRDGKVERTYEDRATFEFYCVEHVI